MANKVISVSNVMFMDKMKQLWNSRQIISCLKSFSSKKRQSRKKRSGAIKSGSLIKPIKMAYNSYESTNPSLASKAPPIIIMHGLLGSKNNWNSISKFLHNKCRRKIYSVDARNHGDSPHTREMSHEHLVGDLLQFIRDFEMKEATLMGHSLGGRAVMCFALKHPELVEKLIVIDISPLSTSPLMNFMPLYLDSMKKVKLSKNLRFAVARKEADRQMAPHILDSGVRQYFLTNLVKGEGGGYKWRVNLSSLIKNYYKLVSFPSVATTFEKPTYFIGGSNSDFIRREEHEEIRKIFKNARFAYIPGAGHLVHLEQPEKFINQVCTFITEDEQVAKKKE